MPKIRYKTYKPKGNAAYLVGKANQILSKYQAQGFSLTLRQLYYQMVAANVIPNHKKSYGQLSSIISRAREGGMIDWSLIKDRARRLIRGECWASGKDFLKCQAHDFAMDLWAGQRVRVEVWVEKEALIEVIGKAAQEYDVPYLACKGYMSASAAWNAAHNRFLHGDCRRYIILHLADHDPSGINMTKDLQYRLEMFSTPYGKLNRPLVEVKRIALNLEQVEQYNCPPNFAKESDPRFKDYKDLFGDESWELDALEPSVIVDLVRDHIIDHMTDEGLFESMKSQQEAVRKNLWNLAEKVEW